jgi:hypothetical protein
MTYLIVTHLLPNPKTYEEGSGILFLVNSKRNLSGINSSGGNSVSMVRLTALNKRYRYLSIVGDPRYQLTKHLGVQLCSLE